MAMDYAQEPRMITAAIGPDWRLWQLTHREGTIRGSERWIVEVYGPDFQHVTLDGDALTIADCLKKLTGTAV